MFRFTIRDVLWLTVVVALGFAWMIQTSERGRAEERAMRDGDRLTWLTERLEANGYHVIHSDRALVGSYIEPPLRPATP